MTDKYEALRAVMSEMKDWFLSKEEPSPYVDMTLSLLAEHDALLAQHHTDSKTLREYAQQRDDLRKERDSLRAALEQYADSSNWCYDTCNIGRGIARDALAQHQGEKHGQ